MDNETAEVSKTVGRDVKVEMKLILTVDWIFNMNT